jgi:hypothetical protein
MLFDAISTVETAVIQLKTQSTEQSVPTTREDAMVYFHIMSL